MNNTFNDDLPNAVIRRVKAQGSRIDADAVLAELSRWVGWYRKETAESRSPKVQHDEAAHIVDLLMDLNKRFVMPNGMSADLRALSLQNMRHLQLTIPEFARIAGCIQGAAEQLEPVRTGKRKNFPRDNAIKFVYESLLQNSTPPLSSIEARHLAAELVSESLGVKCPCDEKELRRITGPVGPIISVK